jgi:hypothetical protein
LSISPICASSSECEPFQLTFGVTTQRWSLDARVHRDERKR